MTETRYDPVWLRDLVAWQKGMTLLAEDTEIRPAALSYVKPSEYRRYAEAAMDTMLSCIAARDAELATLRAQLALVREKGGNVSLAFADWKTHRSAVSDAERKMALEALADVLAALDGAA